MGERLTLPAQDAQVPVAQAEDSQNSGESDRGANLIARQFRKELAPRLRRLDYPNALKSAANAVGSEEMKKLDSDQYDDAVGWAFDKAFNTQWTMTIFGIVELRF